MLSSLFLSGVVLSRSLKSWRLVMMRRKPLGVHRYGSRRQVSTDRVPEQDVPSQVPYQAHRR